MGEFISQEFQRTLGQMLARTENPHEPLNEIGFLMAQEMKTNIDEGGRPNRWPESIRVKKTGGQTLRDKGHLQNSMTHLVEGKSVAAGPGGTAQKYAGILARGGTIRAKNKPFLKFLIPGVGWIQKKEVTIPPRDFTYQSPEAVLTFGDIISDFVLGENS